MKGAPKNAKRNNGTLRRVLRCLRPCRALCVLSLLLSILSVALMLAVPVMLGQAIDCIVGQGQVNFSVVFPLLLRVLGVAALTAVLQWLMNTMNNAITFRVIRDVRAEAFARIQVLPLSYLDTHPSGGIVSRIIADADQLADGLLLGFSQLFSGIATILGTLVFMVCIHAGIAAVVVVLTPLSILVARFVANRTHTMFLAQSEARGAQTALIEEYLGGQKTIRAFGREAQCLEAFDALNDRLSDCSLKASFFSSLTNPGTRFVNSVVYACVAMIGALLCVVGGGTLSVGGLSALLSYAGQYAKPFNEISGVVTELQNAFACAARIFELIDEKPILPDAPTAQKLQNAAGQVDLSHVNFSYVPQRPLIRDFHLTVKPGQRIAIVGPTGCGKTTMINLLMRFYDPDSGTISVDGHDIRTVTRQSLRQNYGMVLQETWLRRGTVRENLLMGKPDATEEEMIAAAVASHADSFIRRLPQGYDTVIGEDGGSLSQGQKQLLCITRVMLRMPPMLILDEATSSIDTRTEVKIQQAFHTMMEGRTSFVVAHRLSTIRTSDIILVMRDGNVIEQGTHQSLLAADGFYANLYRSQFDHEG